MAAKTRIGRSALATCALVAALAFAAGTARAGGCVDGKLKAIGK